MRVSVIESDPGYTGNFGTHGIRVWVAGIERNNVATADDEKRYALLYLLDDKGNVSVNPKTGCPRTEEFWGDVRIELPDGLDPADFTTHEKEDPETLKRRLKDLITPDRHPAADALAWAGWAGFGPEDCGEYGHNQGACGNARRLMGMLDLPRAERNEDLPMCRFCNSSQRTPCKGMHDALDCPVLDPINGDPVYTPSGITKRAPIPGSVAYQVIKAPYQPTPAEVVGAIVAVNGTRMAVRMARYSPPTEHISGHWMLSLDGVERKWERADLTLSDEAMRHFLMRRLED